MTHEEYIEITKELNKTVSLLSSTATIKDCFHHNKKECVLPIKNAHSLQRQGALKQLEKTIQGNAFIYSHTERIHNKEFDFLDLKPVGRKTASTFFGFCSHHDTTLFSGIENNPEITDINSDEHCFLHSYRSFAHSYHRKYEELKLYSTTDKKTIALLHKLHGKSGTESIKQSVQLALDDLAKPKELLDHWMEKNIYDELEYLCFEYPYKIPVACAANTSPSFNTKNVPINISADPNYVYSNVITTVIPFSNRSIIILAAFDNEPNGVDYLDEIDSLKPEILQQKFLSYHLMNNAENCYISPYFLDSKKIGWRREYCRMLDYIGNLATPHMGFNKKFPINYFSPSEALKPSL